MAVKSGSIGNGGYQGRYLEFYWSLVKQDTVSNTSTIFYRVTVVGGTSGYYYHYRDYCEAFGQILVNNNSRTQRRKGDLVSGYTTIKHDVNGNASFKAHVIAAVYTSTTNEDVTGSWELPQIARQAYITNSITTFNDEEDPWFEYTNPANWPLKAWLEPNPNGKHLCQRVFNGVGGKFTWELSQAERIQLRQECSNANNCKIRIGLYSNGETWASFHDRTFTIKDYKPDVGTPTWKTTNLLELADETTVISSCSNIAVTIPEAIAKKEAKIVQYKVVCGSKEVTSAIAGTLNLNNVDSNMIHVYVSDSRENTIEKELKITNFIEYSKPVINNLSLVRTKGGIGNSVVLSFDGKALFKNFGKADNKIQVKYYYKVQGNSTNWILGTTDLLQGMNYSVDSFSNSLEIAGDLGNDGFDISNNYDFKIVVTDKTGESSEVEKTTILTSGIPNMAITKQGVAFGSFYDPDAGGAIQLLGKNIIDLFYPVGAQIYNANKDFDPNVCFLKTEWKLLKGVILGAINNEDKDTNKKTTFNQESGTIIGSKWLQEHNHGRGGHACKEEASGYGLPQSQAFVGRVMIDGNVAGYNTAITGQGDGQNIQPTQLTYIWQRIK